jgi:hypothetical protein
MLCLLKNISEYIYCMDVVATLGALFATILSPPHTIFIGACPPKERHWNFLADLLKGTNS